MSGIDSFGVVNLQGTLVEELLRLSADGSPSTFLIASSPERRAICTGNILSLYDNASTDAENIISDLEFDNELNCACWDLSGLSLVVTDTSGNLHLVTKDGALLFSKKFVTDGTVSAMRFAAKHGDTSVQSLVVVVSSGTILHIENMLLSEVCKAAKENKGMMLSLLQKLQVQKYSYSAPSGALCTSATIEAATNTAPAVATIAFVDSKQSLHYARVVLCSGGESTITVSAVAARTCDDVCILQGADNHLYGLALLGSEYLALISLSDGLLLAELKLPSKASRIVSTSSTTSNGILSAVILVTNERASGSDATAASQTLWLAINGTSSKIVFIGSAALHAVAKSGGARIVCDSGDSLSNVALLVTEEHEAVLMQRSAAVDVIVTCLQDTSSAAVSTTPTNSLEVVRKVVLEGFEANSSTTRSAATFEQYLEYLNLASSAGEAVGVLHLLLQVAHPPAGYLLRLLHATEVVVEKVSGKQHQGAKQRSLLEILRLHHLLETAETLRDRSADEKDSGGGKESASAEESLRLAVLSLTPANVLDTLRDFLRRGKLRQALLVVQRCVREALPLLPTEAVQLPPDDCALEDYVAWVRDGVVHRLTFFNATSVGRAAPIDGVVAVARELMKRASAVEEKFASPVVAVRIAALAKDLLASTPSANSPACAQLIQEVQALYDNLHLQSVIWERWNDHVRLEEVVSLGLQGLVFDRIDSTDETALVEDLRTNILPLIQEFRGDADQFLSDWISETISTRIVLAGEEESLGGDNDNTTCTLSRLVKVASVVADRSVQAKIILVLLQMPVMEELSLRSVKAAEGKNGEKPPTTSRHLESTRMLCELAAAASGFVSAATREALTEATRLLKIKALAASYGVGSFEPRNSKQVRAVVIIIASSVHRPEAVRDALEFASSWGSTSVDIKAVLTRALIQRASNWNLFQSSAALFEEDLKRVLDALPEELKRVVVEDALTFLLDDLVEVSDNITYNPSSKLCDGAEAESKRRAEMVVRAALHLVSHYLDVIREDTAAASADASQARRARFHEQSDCWINSELLATLKKILTLQTAHDIYLCLVDLSNEGVCRGLVTELAQHRVKLLLKDVGASSASVTAEEKRLTAENVPLDAASRKVCLLLNVCPTYFTHVAMKLLVEASQTELAMEVAQALSKEKFMHSSTSALLVNTGIDGSVTNGPENDEDAEKEASLLLDAAVTLCAIAAKKANQISSEDYPVLPSLSLSSAQDAEMPEYLFFPIASFSLSRDLLRCSLAGCPSLFLGRTLDLLSGSETVLAVYDRVEGAATGPREGNQEIISGVLSEGVFARDGILMQASAVAMALMKYSVGEVKRRGRHSSAELRSSQNRHKKLAGAKGAPSSSAWDQPAADLEDLVRILQRSENHLLATRVLYSSWHNGPAKSQLLKSSLLALCRKVLVYRDIDMPFAVACLAALSYDAMVRELKTAVPSIQSDFSRLQTVALVGEELSHLWDNEALLLLFQGLQTNAKWWHILSSLGMKVDLRVFQNPDAQLREKFIRSIIPELFEKCNMDLEMVTEYCRQFDLEPDCAALTYLDILLTAPPTSVSDFAWAGKVRSAAENVEERSILQRLRELLRRVHSLDYEKIRYVCTWIIDLLSAEEEPADMSYPEESDDTTTSFSLRSKAQKVSTAVLQAERGINQELAVYKRYVEIASYLVGLKFPRDATATIKAAAGSKSPYEQVSGTYLERIPLWQLLDDPWSVLDPLLTTVPESAGKLAPLCLPLGLDKSVFNVRKILALYTRMTNTASPAESAAVGTASSLSVSQRELKTVAIQVASEAIDASLSNPLQRIELWQWIYERESSSGDDEHALVALQAALAVAQEHPALTASAHSKESDSASRATLLHQLSKEMQTLQCRRTVRQFNTLIPGAPRVGAKLLSTIANPPQLVRLVLDVVLETSWDLFMQGLLRLGAPVTTYSLSQHPPNHALLEFVRRAGALVDELARHGGLLLPPPPAADSTAPTSTTSQLEHIRHNYIGKMLSDVDSNTAERDTAVGTSAAAQNARKAYWGTATDSTYEPSVAELRRRDDMYLAMSIAVLTLSCSATNQRHAYETQLDSVMRGKGVRVMRRLTARSKFRAAQALSFLQAAPTTSNGSHSNDPTRRAELCQYKTYLHCLSELQEIRLSCAEDSLLDALGMKITDGSIALAQTGADPRALVRTWLHDEGSHVDVVELARDLLVATHFQDAGIWYQLVGHMTSKGLYRSLYQTMLMIECSPVFADVCFGMLGADVLAALVKISADVTDRAEQVLQLTVVRSPTEAPEWLFSKLSLDSNSNSNTSAPSFLGGAPPGGASAGSGENNSTEAAHRHRVFLRPKLACRAEGWEEGAPEDLLPVIHECARLTVSVLQAMSSRVQGKSQASVAALRTVVPRMLTLLAEGDFARCDLAAERGVGAALRTTLLDAASSLIASGVFTAAADVNTALEALDTRHEELLGHLLRAAGNAVDSAVLAGVLEALLLNKGHQIAAERLLWVLRAVTLTADKAAHGQHEQASSGARSSSATLGQALVICLEGRLGTENDLNCIRAVVRSLDAATRTALVAALRGAKLGSLAQVLAGSTAPSVV